MTGITCIGEMLIDFLPVEEQGRTVGFRLHAGGSLLNTAVATARLGRPVALAGKVSTDFFGRFLRAYVEGESVDTRWLRMDDAPTTLAFVAIEAGEPVFSFYGAGAADTLLVVDDMPDELFEWTRILHVGSISLLRGTTPAAVLAACGRLADRALVSLDPNVRPTLVSDEPAYRELLRHLVALAGLVKVSVADLAWLAPGRSAEEAAAGLLREGAGLVVVTCGGDGAFALRGSPAAPEVVRVPGYPVTVRDTIGAGDSFNAGMLTWFADHGVGARAALAALRVDDLAAALRFAVAVAALNCTRAGADPPTRGAVEDLLGATPPGVTDGPEGESNDDH